MKRIHKILLTVSFVFAVCFSAGMFFTFSDSIKNNSNKDQTADAYSNVTYNYSLALVCLKSPVVKSTDTFQLKNVDYNIGKYVSEDGYTSTSLANTSITFTNFTGAGGCTGTSASGNGTNWIKGNVYMKLTFIGGDKHSYYDVNYSISSKNAGFEAYLSYCLIKPLTSTDIGNVTASQVSSFWKTDSSQSAAKNMTHTLKFSGNETKNYQHIARLMEITTIAQHQQEKVTHLLAGIIQVELEFIVQHIKPQQAMKPSQHVGQETTIMLM